MSKTAQDYNLTTMVVRCKIVEGLQASVGAMRGANVLWLVADSKVKVSLTRKLRHVYIMPD